VIHCQLAVDETVKPDILLPRKLPLIIRSDVKANFDDMVQLSVITQVTEPTQWVSSMVAVRKPSGAMRLCSDPKPLNKALQRNHDPMPIIEDILSSLSNAKFFTVINAKNRFWHGNMSDKSSYLTTFAIPYGRFRWFLMPLGIAPAPEEFQRRMHDAPGTATVADDILVHQQRARSTRRIASPTMPIVIGRKSTEQKKHVNYLGSKGFL
jgi:hypothetical protein